LCSGVPETIQRRGELSLRHTRASCVVELRTCASGA
jgi:hypothetical protein